MHRFLCSVRGMSAVGLLAAAIPFGLTAQTQNSALPSSTAAQPSPSSVPNSQPAALSNPQIPSKVASADDYHVGEGDTLQISVWKEPDASVANAIVRPDGKITMPILKDIYVAGMTPAEIQAHIVEKLNSFIPGVDVTVIVTGMNSKKVYILGAVKKEGPIAYNYRMSAMQALAEAGGLTDYAKRKKIYVLRTQNGKEEKIKFDYNGVLSGKHTDNVILESGDTIVVPH